MNDFSQRIANPSVKSTLFWRWASEEETAHARCYAKLDARTQVTVRVPQVLHCGRALRASFEAPTVAGLARTITLTCIYTSDHGDALRLLLAKVERPPDGEPERASAPNKMPRAGA